jgi:nitroimidazol reductase NimA-like FMN-containing flavoprotein (pyridoxamine 5'-phosphate oxidase superfamily)
MAFEDLSPAEIERLLAVERVVRLGFDAGGERYLVPLGFVSHQGALYALTTRGRKTRMAAASPAVSFQIDSSARTGVFQWHSVSGEGTFEIVADPAESETAAALLTARFPDMPDWMQAEYAERERRGETVIVRIRPTRLGGRKSGPA